MDIEKEIVTLLDRDEENRYHLSKVQKRTEYEQLLLIRDIRVLLPDISDIDSLERLSSLINRSKILHTLFEDRIEELKSNS